MDTPGTNENLKASNRQVEIGQHTPQTLYLPPPLLTVAITSRYKPFPEREKERIKEREKERRGRERES